MAVGFGYFNLGAIFVFLRLSIPRLLLLRVCVRNAPVYMGTLSILQAIALTFLMAWGKHSKGDPVFPVGATYLISGAETVELVTEILLRQRIIVIRASPMTGISTLLNLLGQHIYRNHLDLKPIKVVWPKHRGGKNNPRLYGFFLQDFVEETNALHMCTSSF